MIAALSNDSTKPLVVDILVPARNNASSLAGVLGAIPMRGVRSVVVVDNDSRDGTTQVARDSGAVVLREPRVGYGAACLRGCAHLGALPRPPDVVVFLAADGTSDPADLRSLLDPIVSDNAELVIGVRQREGRPRRTDTKVAIGLISAIYRHRFDDLGPFRAIRFPALVAMGMADRGVGWNVEMQVKAIKLGLHIAEVPVTSRRLTRRNAAKVKETLESVGRTGRVLFQIFRNATTR